MAKKIYEARVSGKRGSERSRLTFGNIVSIILEEGHVKSISIPRGRICGLATVDEA